MLEIKYGKSKKQVYDDLDKDGLFLPDYKSKCVNREYLRKCQGRQVICVEKKHVAVYKFPLSITKQTIFCYFSDRISAEEWGFDFESIPNSDWLLSVCANQFPEDSLSQAASELRTASARRAYAVFNKEAVQPFERSLNDAQARFDYECAEVFKKTYETEANMYTEKIHALINEITSDYPFIKRRLRLNL
ncbi:MAG: hypothetical protein ACRYGG_22760 [Janthinobacterium lividum]